MNELINEIIKWMYELTFGRPIVRSGCFSHWTSLWLIPTWFWHVVYSLHIWRGKFVTNQQHDHQCQGCCPTEPGYFHDVHLSWWVSGCTSRVVPARVSDVIYCPYTLISDMTRIVTCKQSSANGKKQQISWDKKFTVSSQICCVPKFKKFTTCVSRNSQHIYLYSSHNKRHIAFLSFRYSMYFFFYKSQLRIFFR
jgi:hypothetical protein